MLLRHCPRRAASRAAWTAGSRRAISTAMIAMTTSNSINVKARAVRRLIGEVLMEGESLTGSAPFGPGMGSSAESRRDPSGPRRWSFRFETGVAAAPAVVLRDLGLLHLGQQPFDQALGRVVLGLGLEARADRGH